MTAAEDTSLAELIEQYRSSAKISLAELAKRARVATIAIGRMKEPESWRRHLESLKNKRQRDGTASSLYALLSFIGEDPKPWLEKFGLPTAVYGMTNEKKFLTEFSAIRHQPITQDDLRMIGRVATELGDLFTIELAMTLICRTHSGQRPK